MEFLELQSPNSSEFISQLHTPHEPCSQNKTIAIYCLNSLDRGRFLN